LGSGFSSFRSDLGESVGTVLPLQNARSREATRLHAKSSDVGQEIAAVVGPGLLDIRPATRPARLVNKRAQTTAALSMTSVGNTEMLVAAGA